MDFLFQHLREHWDVLRHGQPKDTAFGFLTLLEKTGLPEAGSLTRLAHHE